MMYVKICECCEKTFISKSNRKRYCSKACAKEMTRRMREQGEQLCWRCKNSCGGCNWSRFFEPVEGLTAEATIIKDSNGDIQSYRIKKCPEFIKD